MASRDDPTHSNDDDERLEAKRQKDPEDQLHDAPDDGEVIRDYFSFNEIFARVLSTADHELAASNRYLFWSALGAGGALGLTFLARVIFTEAAGEVSPGIVGNMLYPVGFLIIVLGRYQLFTENTLTPVVLVLTKLASVANTLRLWVVVLLANMIGALAVAWLLVFFEVFDVQQTELAIEMGRHAYEQSWYGLFSKALIAGWIVAAMVWLVHAGRDTVSKIFVIYVLMYFIGVASLYHIITSSVEVFYLAYQVDDVGFLTVFPDFVLPVLLGNTVGGVTFVAVLNYALFAEHEDSEMFRRYGEQLDFKTWMFSLSTKKKDR